jgi:hypothetical protein
MLSVHPKEIDMTGNASTTLREQAQALRREELARRGRLLKVEWSTLITKMAGAIANGLRQWHAHARNLRLD